MDKFSAADLRRLMAHRVDQCVSLFMPTYPSSHESAQDAVRVKNLADRAQVELEEHGMRSAEARDMLRPVRDMTLDEIFWMERSQGLAMFIARDIFERFRLPSPFPEDVVVNRRFHVKPLLPLLNTDATYFILALSQHRPRLFQASRYGAKLMQVPNMPGAKEEALNYQEAERSSQAHQTLRGDAGKQGLAFHGHGGVRDTGKEGTMQYFRMIDAALWPLLRHESAPLVMVGVEYLVPMYRAICQYPHLLEESVQGSADHWTDTQLHEKTWPLIERRARNHRDVATAKFRQLHGTGKASDNIVEIAPAAVTGKVDCLLVDPRARKWGTVDVHTNHVDVRDTPWPGDEDLIDFAAIETLNNRGLVFAVESAHMPTSSPVAAVFRY